MGKVLCFFGKTPEKGIKKGKEAVVRRVFSLAGVKDDLKRGQRCRPDKKCRRRKGRDFPFLSPLSSKNRKKSIPVSKERTLAEYVVRIFCLLYTSPSPRD